MHKNQPITQKLTVHRRTHTAKGMQFSRPTYALVIDSRHNDVDGTGALITITIPKATAEALEQDHGAEWSDDPV